MFDFLFYKYNMTVTNIMHWINIFALIFFCIVLVFCIFKQSNSKQKKYIELINKNHYLILLLIVFTGTFIRLYKLSQYPVTCPPDESSAMYDALCILNYGTNRWGQVNAVYFDTWGFAGQSPAMANLMALSMKIFGQSIFAMRLAQAIPASLSILIIYRISKKLFGDFLGLVSAAVLAVSPYHIMLSRWGLDCNLSAFFTATTFLFLLYSFDKDGKMNKVFYAFCIFGALSLYTYALTCISMFIFVVLTYIYLLAKGKINWRIFIPANIIFGILALPMIYFVLVNKGFVPPVEISFITIPQLAHFRSNEISYNILYNLICTAKELYGHSPLLVTILPEFRLFYGFSLVFVLAGLIILVKKIVRHQECIFLLFWFLGAVITTATINEGGTTRSVNIWIILPIFIALAINWMINKLPATIFPVVAVYAAGFVLFTYGYFINYAQVTGIQASASEIDAIHFASKTICSDTIYCSMYNGTADAFIFYALDNQDSPDEYQKKIVRIPDEEQGYLIKQYDNFIFFEDVYEKAIENKDNTSVAFILNKYVDDMARFTNIGYSLEEFDHFVVAYK